MICFSEHLVVSKRAHYKRPVVLCYYNLQKKGLINKKGKCNYRAVEEVEGMTQDGIDFGDEQLPGLFGMILIHFTRKQRHQVFCCQSGQLHPKTTEDRKH